MSSVYHPSFSYTPRRNLTPVQAKPIPEFGAAWSGVCDVEVKIMPLAALPSNPQSAR